MKTRKAALWACPWIILALVSSAPAATKTWIAEGDPNLLQSWHGSGNWDPSGEPTADDTCSIVGGKTSWISEAGEECDQLLIGPGGDGRVQMSLGSTLQANTLDLYNGFFNHYGGTNTVGYLIVRNGTYEMSGGEVQADCLHTGLYGDGVFRQTAGSVKAGYMRIGWDDANSSGTYLLEGGATLTMDTDYAEGGGDLFVGKMAHGTLKIGDATAAGTINQTGSGSADMTIRDYGNISGTVFGWGGVNLTGRLTNNGRVIADGYGAARALDLSDFTEVASDIDNNSDNGWYARNKGSLVLPAISVSSSQTQYSWGERSTEGYRDIDLVNSFQALFAWKESGGPGSGAAFEGSLVDPELVGQAMGRHIAGAWKFNGTGLNGTYESVEMIFRYDDTRVFAGSDPLEIWYCLDPFATSPDWRKANIAFFDGNDKVVSSVYMPQSCAFDYYWIVVPEPCTLSLLGLAGLAMLRRRKM